MAVGGRAVAAAGLLLAASTVAAGVAPNAPALARARVATRGQEAAPRSVATETEPLVGDFNGDGPRDLLWHATSSGTGRGRAQTSSGSATCRQPAQ